MTQGQTGPSKSTVNGVNPTGDLTPTRPTAAASLGFVSPATKRPAEGICGTRALVRVEWWQRLGLGWPESSPALSLAVAGARVSSGSTLRWPGRLVRGTYVLYVAREGS